MKPWNDGDLKRQKQGYTAVCLIGLPKGDLARWQKYTVFSSKYQAPGTHFPKKYETAKRTEPKSPVRFNIHSFWP